MRTSSWYEIKNQTESMADLYLYGEVGGFGANASEFISALSELKGAHINLHIHSPGGSVFEGHAIFNALRNHPGGVTTHVDGIAASMASVIAMAGKPVKIASNGFLMIHNPWATFSGDAQEMRQEADVLDKLKEGLVKIYSDKSGQDSQTIRAAMDAETWFDAEEALAFGFADEVYDGLEAVAKVDVSKFAKAPESLRKRMAAESDMTIAVDLDGTLAKDDGWKGISHIGEPVPAMLARVKEWIGRGKNIVIFTARASDNAAIPYIEDWLTTNGIGGLKITNVKTEDIDEIWDNIAVRVEKNTGQRISKLMNNEPTAEAVASTAEAVDALKLEVTVEVSEEPAQDPNAPEQPMPEEPAMPEQPMPDATSVIMAEASIDFAAKLTEANALLDSMRAQIAERDVVIAKLTDELAKAKAEASVTPEKINALATRVVASAGHPAVEFTTGEPTALPKQDLVAQYNELRKNGKSAEWLAFLKKNRSALMSAAK